MKNIVFWRISYSHHMDALFSEVRRLAAPAKVTIVYLEALRQERKDLGWPDKKSIHENDLFQPDTARMSQLIDQTSDAAFLHVFSGILYHQAMRSAFIRVLSKPCRKLLLTEGRDFRGAKGMLRLIQGWWLEGRRHQHIDMVLTLGELGASNYRTLGFDANKVRPFSYVVEPSTSFTAQFAESRADVSRLRFVIIGRLIPLKRVDLVIQALAMLPNKNWRLVIVGDGPERPALERLAASSGFESENIQFAGVLPNAEVRSLLSTIDYMIFASNRDGWGAVVNESLMAGTPVICSHYPGASTLIHPGFNGMLFETDQLQSLASVLDSCVRKGATSTADRQRIARWATCIYPDAMARYFLDLLTPETSACPPPWQSLTQLRHSN